MEERDVADRVRWFNDPAVRETLGIDYPPLSEIGTRQWLQRSALNNNRKDFVICLHEGNRSIGCTGLRAIDWRHSRAETYLAIGEKGLWGQGYGKESQYLLLHYSFNTLGLNRLYSFSLASNERMIRVNQSLGFQIEGTLRDDVFDNGEFRDRTLMAITAATYRNRVAPV
jgi:RimJ/RimL family protein N-acetyltransferase